MDVKVKRIISNFDHEYELYNRGDKQSAIFDYFNDHNCVKPFYISKDDFKALSTKSGQVLNGPVIIIYNNGSVFIGETKNNQRIGKSVKTLTTDQNLVYIGDYNDNCKSGKGEIIEINSGDVIYTGDWSNGKKHGYGVWKNKENGKLIATYMGQFANDFMHGHGSMKWENGNIYEGDFINGDRSGRGIITFANGDKYEGEFLKNVFEGNGKYIWKNGEVYEGSFSKGKPFGTGSIHYKMNVMASGTFDGLNVKKGGYMISDTEISNDHPKFDVKQNGK